jgi:hypothetical protein
MVKLPIDNICRIYNVSGLWVVGNDSPHVNLIGSLFYFV